MSYTLFRVFISIISLLILFPMSASICILYTYSCTLLLYFLECKFNKLVVALNIQCTILLVKYHCWQLLFIGKIWNPNTGNQLYNLLTLTRTN